MHPEYESRVEKPKSRETTRRKTIQRWNFLPLPCLATATATVCMYVDLAGGACWCLPWRGDKYDRYDMVIVVEFLIFSYFSNFHIPVKKCVLAAQVFVYSCACVACICFYADGK